MPLDTVTPVTFPLLSSGFEEENAAWQITY
jgi:hypothetical protein